MTGNIFKFIIYIAIFSTVFLALLHFNKNDVMPEPLTYTQPKTESTPEPPKKPETPPKQPVDKPNFAYLNYNQTVEQLLSWENKAPLLCEVGTYGKSNGDKDLYYIRIRNELDDTPKAKVLIHACIHGNEPHAASIVTSYIGEMLSQYKTDSRITELINERDITFIPIVNPDSYPRSRWVDGVDPNRNFPVPDRDLKESIKTIEALKDFFKKNQFDAVASGHTWGRVFLIPWGYKKDICENHKDYIDIVGQITDSPYNFKYYCQIDNIPQKVRLAYGENMSEMSGYGVLQASRIYRNPIYGSEVDWYYNRGALSIVIEYGTHQKIPSLSETTSETDKTFNAILTFIEKAPLVKVSTKVNSKKNLPFFRD